MADALPSCPTFVGGTADSGALAFALIHSGLYGRRKEAVLSLRWANVSLSNGTIDFKREGRVETTKRRGAVRVHRKVLSHLQRIKRRRGVGELDYVIQWHGRRIHNVKESFAAAVEGVGLGKHVTPHVLKHTCVSWLLQSGVSLWDAAQFFSTSVPTLERVYGHHCPSHQERALRAFDCPLNVRVTNSAKQGNFARIERLPERKG
jgi:integrase